jgi:hypothetical protein
VSSGLGSAVAVEAARGLDFKMMHHGQRNRTCFPLTRTILSIGATVKATIHFDAELCDDRPALVGIGEGAVGKVSPSRSASRDPIAESANRAHRARCFFPTERLRRQGVDEM